MSSFFYESIATELEKQTTGEIPRKLWGYELCISMEGCQENLMMNVELCKKFVTTIVDKLYMQPVGESIARLFKDKDGSGVSVLQLLTTSHVGLHTDLSENAAFLDVFSCDYYNPKDILPYIKEVFQPKKWEYIFILRNPGMVKVLKNV